MKISILIKSRRFRILCYSVLAIFVVIVYCIKPEREAPKLNDVIANPTISRQLASVLGGFSEKTLNTPLNQFFDNEDSTNIRKKSIYDRNIKKWVYNPEYQHQLSQYLSSMVRDSEKEDCAEFHRVIPPGSTKKRNAFIEEFDQPSFTAIYVTNYLRIHLIPEKIKQWKGPIIFVIYMSTEKQSDIVTKFLLSKHFSEDVQIFTFEGKSSCFSMKHFPINKLRNLAIDFVTTTHYIVLDMDVHLSNNVYESLMNVPSFQWMDYHTVVIVPLFFFTPEGVNVSECNNLKNCTKLSEEKAPNTVYELKECIKQNQCRIGKDYTQTHHYVSMNWFKDGIGLERVDCASYEGIEPYVVLRNHPLTPRYDPLFYDYGGNKQLLIEQLRYFSNEWYILKNAFAIDLVHPKSSFRIRYDEEYTSGMCMNPFLIQLRLYEIRHESIPYLPICM